MQDQHIPVWVAIAMFVLPCPTVQLVLRNHMESPIHVSVDMLCLILYWAAVSLRLFVNTMACLAKHILYVMQGRTQSSPELCVHIRRTQAHTCVHTSACVCRIQVPCLQPMGNRFEVLPFILSRYQCSLNFPAAQMLVWMFIPRVRIDSSYALVVVRWPVPGALPEKLYDVRTSIRDWFGLLFFVHMLELELCFQNLARCVGQVNIVVVEACFGKMFSKEASDASLTWCFSIAWASLAAVSANRVTAYPLEDRMLATKSG